MKLSEAKVKPAEFRNRYVLGEGYPWVLGVGPYYEIRLQQGPMVTDGVVQICWPEELWAKNLPKYQLVLERVETLDDCFDKDVFIHDWEIELVSLGAVARVLLAACKAAKWYIEHRATKHAVEILDDALVYAQKHVDEYDIV